MKIKYTKRLLMILLLILGNISQITAQDISTEEKIQILEEEIEQLKEKKATKQYKSFQGLGPAASGVYYVDDGLSWGGYGEIKYKNYKTPYAQDTADVHRLILYAGYKFNDWIILNSEIEYEHAGSKTTTLSYCEDINAGNCQKKTTTIKEGQVFVEFAYLDFLLTDYFQIAMGLQLIPVGITNYFHEPTTFFSVERPYTETEIIPSTWKEIGIMIHGKIWNDRILYRLGVFNGLKGNQFSENSWIKNGRQGGSKVKYEDISYVASIDIFPIEGLMIGGSYFIGNSGQREIEKVDIFSRIDFTNLISDSQLRSYVEKGFSNSRKISPTVHLAEGHIKYEGKGFYFQSLLAKGWIREDEVRSLNQATGKNIGSTVEGGYAMIGYDIASLLGWKKKLIVFYKNEYLNTQKRTLKNNGQLFLEDEIARNSQGVFSTNYTDTSINNSLNSTEAVAVLEQYNVKGVSNPVNDRRIQTIGIAFYPHPNISLKIDYEDWESKTNYYQDSDFNNQSNNKIDKINAAITFIF